MRTIYTYCLIICLVALSACRGCNQKKLPSLKETYQQNDKKPFGGFIAFKEFEIILKQTDINILTGPLIELWNLIKDEDDEENKGNQDYVPEYALYFLVTKNLLLDAYDINTILSFADKGNDLFISADYIQPEFLEKIHVVIDRTKEIMTEAQGKMEDTFLPDYLKAGGAKVMYGYYYYPFTNSIRFERKSGEALGFNKDGQPNFIVLKWGKGHIYLHVAPRAFSNYFLLTGNNLDYYRYILSTLPTDPSYFIWDEYYKLHPSKRVQKENNKSNFSTLSAIKQYPSLLWAFWISVVGIILFVIFNSKRKQRIVPEIPPNSNATVAFTETIGRLYLQHKDNRNIADKQITYFYEKIRNNYFINTANVDEEFLISLSGKSGVPLEETSDLIGLVKNIQMQEEISDEQLMSLNDKISNFNKNRK
ncbi:MAG: hypothetical protein ABIW47_00445 [Ginsengibacter sp.]